MDLVAYVNGDVRTVSQILSTVALIFDGDSFNVAARVAVVLGIILTLLAGLGQGKLHPGTFILPMVIVALGLIPRVNLIIEDQYGGLASIDDLPVAVAAPISVVTTIGRGVTDMFTTNLGLDDNSISMDNGHIVALRAPIAYAQVLTDDEMLGGAALLSTGLDVIEDSRAYVMECVSYALNHNLAGMNKSSLMAGPVDTAFDVDNTFFTVATSSGGSMLCGDMFDALITGIEDDEFAEAVQDALDRVFGRYQGDTTTGARYQQALENMVDDKTEFFEAVIFGNALKAAQADMTIAGGGGSTVAALEDAVDQRREKNFGSAAMVFERITQTMTFVEAWSLSIMPLMALVMLAGPTGLKLGGKYLWMLIWIQLWFPTILIVVAILDAMTTTAAFSSTASVANMNGFLMEMLRLQDVGYLYLSMATMLSMILIYGSSAILANSIQGDLTAGDTYNPLKNSPDSLQRAPTIQYQSAFSHSQAGGYVGTEAASSFGNVVFSLDRSLASGVSSVAAENFARTGQYSTQQSAGQAAATTASTGVSAGATSTSVHSISESRTGSVDTNREVGVSQSAGASSSESSTVGTSTQMSANTTGGARATASGSFGDAGNGQTAPGGAAEGNERNGLSAGASISGSAAATASTSDSSSAAHATNSSADARHANTARVGRGSAASDQRVESGSTDATSRDTLTGSTVIDSREQVARGESETRTSSEASQQQSGRTTEQRVSTGQINGMQWANNVAKDPAIMRRLDETVINTGISSAVRDFMIRNKDRLAQTFYGPDAEDAKFAFSSMAVMQGLAGGAYTNGPHAKERIATLNAIGDEFLNMSTFAERPGQQGVDTANLDATPRAGQDARLAAEAGFRGYALQQDDVYGAIAEGRPTGNLAGDFNQVLDRLGTNLEGLAPGQINGILYGMRDNADTRDARTKADEETTAQTIREHGYAAAVQGMVWAGDEVEDRQAAIAAMRSSVDAARQTNPEATDLDIARNALDQRLTDLKEAGVLSNGSPVANYMAVSQLEAGAILAQDQAMADAFGALRREQRATDPELASIAGDRIAAMSLAAVTPEAFESRLSVAEMEAGMGRLEHDLRLETGLDINSRGDQISWGRPGSAFSSRGEAESAYLDYMVQSGLRQHEAEGFIMNFRDESGMDAGINERSPLVPGSRGGFGLYQLTGPRRVQFEDWAAENGRHLDDGFAQIDFMMQELQTTERATMGALQQTTTSGEAAAVIVNQFLRPAEEHREARAARYLSAA